MPIAPNAIDPGTPGRAAARRGATLSLGFALGGFFDGIVLHQVLQWHHLLSGLDAPALADPGAQVLADGLFHAAMYVIAVVAIVALLRPGPRPGGLRTTGLVLLGFAAWHALDTVLSHWLLGLHRIRTDAGPPLAWDLGWLLAFGVLPAVLGARWARIGLGSPGGRAATASSGRPGGSPGPPLAWAAVAIAAGSVAARPAPVAPDGTRAVTALLARADDAHRLLAALPSGASVVGSDRSGRLWHLRLPADASGLRLLGRGAVWVAGTAVTPGCAAWLEAGREPAPGRS